jgi:hypothetical protein
LNKTIHGSLFEKMATRLLTKGSGVFGALGGGDWSRRAALGAVVNDATCRAGRGAVAAGWGHTAWCSDEGRVFVTTDALYHRSSVPLYHRRLYHRCFIPQMQLFHTSAAYTTDATFFIPDALHVQTGYFHTTVVF